MSGSGQPGDQGRRPPVGVLEPEPYGRYLLLDRIDVGGMAEVFRGRMGGVDGFERIVALKRILPNIAADPDFVEMFVDEAKLAVQFRHANIAQIYELGKAKGTHFIAMEYVSGVDLRTMWDRARARARLLPIAMSCHILQKACEGLDAAHRKRDDRTGEDLGLVHRDVSPQNILVSFEGEVKVIDFGIAKAANKVSKTQAGVLKGKFGYMSPEQVRGIELDNRSDVFACGVVLYELLVGDRLFLGESDFSTLEKIRNLEMVPPTHLNKNLSPHLERIVMKALSKNREDRYRWASEMAEDLQRYLFATNQPFSRTDLQRYMQQHFREQMAEEQARLARYREIEPLPEEASASAEPSTEVAAINGLGPPLGDFDAQATESARASHPVPVGFGDDASSAPAPTALIDPALPPSAAQSSLPTWAALVIGGLLAVVAIGGAAAFLWTQGILGSPGALELTIDPPYARVFLDERLVANGSPVVLDRLEPGTHVLSVRAPGFKETVRPVSVARGETQMITLRLEPLADAATLEITSEPAGLQIGLDGDRTGRVTPAKLAGLSPGTHRVELRNREGQLVHRFAVELAPKQVEVRAVEVSKLPPLLDVTSEPPGAEVRVGGLLRGVTPITVTGLEPGPVTVEIRKADCPTAHREDTTLAGGRIVAVRAQLECP